jgi:hypothetical protein
LDSLQQFRILFTKMLRDGFLSRLKAVVATNHTVFHFDF